MRPIQWHLKRHWRVPESLEKEIPVPRTLHPHLQWWTKETNVLLSLANLCTLSVMPFKCCRWFKRRLGCSLRRLHSKRHLVSSRKSTTYKYLGTEGGLASTKKVPAHGTGESCSSCHRQHYSCGIHKQGGRYEVRLTLCPSMVAPVLVQSETCCPKGQTHPRSSECDCGQIVSTRPNNSDGMVSSSRGIRSPVSNMAPSPGRHVCDQVQLQANQVCVSSTRPQCLGSGHSNSLLGELGQYAFPSVSLLGKVVRKLSDHLYKRVILIAPGWPN